MNGHRSVAIALVFGLVSTPLMGQEKPLRQIIDAEVRAVWQSEKITPAPRSTDAEFLRRIYIDLVGTIPSYEETTKFLNDSDPQKREKLVDQLLADPRYAQQQSTIWDLVFFGRHPAGYEATRKRDAFKKWLGEKFAKNVPYDQWVKSLLLAEEEGSQVYYVQYRNQPEEATVGISRVFLGTQLECARCHDHPFDKWTQKDFYGMAGFFVRLVVIENGAAANRSFVIGEKSTGEVLFTGPVKEQKPGKKGDPVAPKFLGGAPLNEPPLPKDFKDVEVKTGIKTMPKPVFSRKEQLANWVTAPGNPYFAQAAVNRVWAQFMGRGFVHPVDDLSEKNTPSHPALFKTLTKKFADQKFDLKWLIRELVNSETYQLSGVGTQKDALPKSYERARIRPLSAEEIVTAYRQATLYDAGDPKTVGSPLPNAGNEYFLRFFGEPTNGLGDFQGSLAEHLFMNSGPIWQMIRGRKGTLLEVLTTSKDPVDQKVDRLFLTTLNRMPKESEKKKFTEFLSKADPKSNPWDEAIWVLLNSAEFRFNH